MKFRLAYMTLLASCFVSVAVSAAVGLPDMEDSEAFIIFNPKITVLDKTEQGFWEGCLSVPGLRGFVERPRKIRVDFLDESAKLRSIATAFDLQVIAN